MKNLLKGVGVIAIVSMFVFSGGLFAQGYKFGHINFQQLIQVMPESTAAQESLQKHGSELEDQLRIMQQELQSKSREYMEQLDAMTNAVKAAKESDLQDLNQRIQDFQQMAQQDLQKKEQDVLQPILERAREAISEVAKENQLLYVFEVNSLLYNGSESVDLLPLVKTKLGIQ